MIAQDYFMYLLKVTGISGLLFGYYLLALRNKKFHRYNRFYLLASILLSLTLPLLQFNWFSIEEQTPIYQSTRIVYAIIPSGDAAEAPTQPGLWNYGFIAFLIISAVLLFMLLFQIIQIYQLKNRQQKVVMDGFCMIETDQDDAPFSFMQNLFWRKTIDIETEEGKQILTHELTHIKEKHTLDRLFCQIVTGLFWANPFFWMMQKELEAVHEFLADEQATKNADGDAFARMLLTAHFGHRFMAPTHTFFYASIKRRLSMLTASATTKYSYFRRLMVIPLTVLLMALFSFTLKQTAPIQKTVKKEKSHAAIPDTTKPGDEQQRKWKPKPPRKDVASQSLLKFRVLDTVPEPQTKATDRDLRDLLIVIDGKAQEGDNKVIMKNINLSAIERFSIIKNDSAAAAKYGARAVKNVIVIETNNVVDTTSNPK